jgi:hypothetical protein
MRYEVRVHDELVLTRTPTRGQGPLENAGRELRSNVVAGLMNLALLPLEIIIELPPYVPAPPKETQFEPIVGSERIEAIYASEAQTQAMANKQLVSARFGTVVTDANGIVTFPAVPADFDQGIVVQQASTGEKYLIQRTRTSETSRANWYPAVNLANNVVGGLMTIRKIGGIIIAGGGVVAVVVALIVDLATGAIIGFLIDALATSTVDHFQWLVMNVS